MKMDYFKNEKNRLNAAIKKSKKILLLAHVDPDGDAIGSMFGLGYILQKKGKNPIIGLNVPIPDKQSFFDVDGSLNSSKADNINLKKIDLIIVMDSANISRLGSFQPLVEKFKETGGGVRVINIDHHDYNDNFGNLNIVDSMSSSATQIIVELFGKRALDDNSAFCLYAGIVADTGSFRHGKNIVRTHKTAALCLSFNVDSEIVYQNLFAIETEQTLKLFARALTNLKIESDGELVTFFLTTEDYQSLNATPAESSGFINKILLLEHAKFVLFFNEVEKNVIKVSVRSSSGFNLAEFATKFDGGGHVKAAGFSMEGLLEKSIERVKNSLKIGYQTMLEKDKQSQVKAK